MSHNAFPDKGFSNSSSDEIEAAGYATNEKLQYPQESIISDKVYPSGLHERLSEEFGVSEHDIDYLLGIINNMTVEEAREILAQVLVDHKKDRNFQKASYDSIVNLLANEKDVSTVEMVDTDFAIKAQAALIYHHSPYPEVRAVTSPYDTDVTVESIRAYVLGTIFVLIGTGVNQFFSVHQPPVTIPATFFQLLILPCGWGLAKVLPDWGFTVFGNRITLNPGPWSYKEQTLCTIMFGIANAIPYVDSQILVQKMPMFYGQEWANVGYQFLLTLSTQFMGFGIAGLMRSILIYPSWNQWMVNFPILALNRGLMINNEKSQSTLHGWKISGAKFFCICFAGIFLYEWIPQYLMQFLGTFNWMTWIAPKNFNLAAITGSIDGLGLNPIPTFDWTTINFSAPLVTPFFAMCNMLFGGLLAGCVLIPAIYWTNMYNSGYLPINSSSLYTNTAENYKISEVLTDGLLDIDKYQKYSPPYYSAANLVVYGSFFANYTCIFVRSLLYDWRVMYMGYKEVALSVVGKGKGVHGFNDAHSRMMQKYPETPMWWFLVIFLISLGLAIATVKAYPESRTPVWGIFFSVGISIVFLVPIGNLYAQTNTLFSLNVITELVAGYALPGNGIAMMIIKAFGLNTNLQAIYFMQDLKLGHYAKIPPRATFRAQVLATLWGAITMIGVVNWQMGNVKDLCIKKPDGSNKFWCPSETVYFAASVQWGVIAPKRVFNSSYPILKWCFLIGCFIPIPFWAADVLLDRFIEKQRLRGIVNRKSLAERAHFFVRLLDPNVMLMGILNFFAPYNLAYLIPGFYVNFAFLYYIRKRYLSWFEKYNYLLAAALGAGTAFSLVIIFFSVTYHPKSLDWWGNKVFGNGVDGSGAARMTLAEGTHFGPSPGSYYIG